MGSKLLVGVVALGLATLTAVTPQSQSVTRGSRSEQAEAVDAQEAVTPWVSPDGVGITNPDVPLKLNKWGWNIPVDLGTDIHDVALSGTNNAVVSTHNHGAGGPVKIQQTRIYGSPEVLAGPVKVKWGVWARDVWDWDIRDTTIDTIWVEHGLYLGAVGGLNLSRVWVDEVWGQALQVVYCHPGSKREHETGLTDNQWWRRFNATRWDWHTVTQSAFTQVAIPPLSERGSFVLSFFGMEYPVQANPVQVSRCYFKTYYPWTDANGMQRDCAGAIMVHGRLRCTLDNNRIEFGRGDRDLVQIWGVTDNDPDTVDILITQNWIEGSKPVDIRVWDPSTKIVIRRNRGNADVVVSSNPPYVWENNGWDEKKVLWRGKISDEYRLN